MQSTAFLTVNAKSVGHNDYEEQSTKDNFSLILENYFYQRTSIKKKKTYLQE